MTDIVERLRERIELGDGLSLPPSELEIEAADEIERLREALCKVSSYDPTRQPYDEPLRHVEKLVPCTQCGGAGRIYGADPGDYGTCPVCRGYGAVEVQP